MDSRVQESLFRQVRSVCGFPVPERKRPVFELGQTRDAAVCMGKNRAAGDGAHSACSHCRIACFARRIEFVGGD